MREIEALLDKQFCQPYSQRLRKPVERLERRVAVAEFDSRDVAPVESCLLGEALLRPTPFRP
jgi:hypothetical protein